MLCYPPTLLQRRVNTGRPEILSSTTLLEARCLLPLFSLDDSFPTHSSEGLEGVGGAALKEELEACVSCVPAALVGYSLGFVAGENSITIPPAVLSPLQDSCMSKHMARTSKAEHQQKTHHTANGRERGEGRVNPGPVKQHHAL